MDLLIMTNRAEIHEFYKKRLNRGTFLSCQGFQNVFIRGKEVSNKCNISAQYVKHYAC